MSELRWDDLKLFLVAYRLRSLTQAAKQLEFSQSTLSRRLQGLEETLGGRLFDRTPDGVAPTDLADSLLAAAERGEAAANDALRIAARGESEVSGSVRVAVSDGPAFYLLAPRLPEFHARHPLVEVTLVVDHTMVDLTRREADIALRFVKPTRGDLVARRLSEDDYAVFASEQLSRSLGPGPHLWSALPWIRWDEVTQPHLPEEVWAHREALDSRVRATTMTARIMAAQCGGGVIALPELFGDVLGFERVDTRRPPLHAKTWLVTHRALREVPRVRVTLDWIAGLYEELYRW